MHLNVPVYYSGEQCGRWVHCLRLSGLLTVELYCLSHSQNFLFKSLFLFDIKVTITANIYMCDILI